MLTCPLVGKIVISLPSKSHMPPFHFPVIMKYDEKLVSLTERAVFKNLTLSLAEYKTQRSVYV